MNIPLDNHFSIQSDSRQWILAEDNRGIGYYQDLESLIKSYFKRKILDSTTNSMQELLLIHKSVLNKLSKALQPLNIGVEGLNLQVFPEEFKIRNLEGKK